MGLKQECFYCKQKTVARRGGFSYENFPTAKVGYNSSIVANHVARKPHIKAINTNINNFILITEP